MQRRRKTALAARFERFLHGLCAVVALAAGLHLRPLSRRAPSSRPSTSATSWNVATFSLWASCSRQASG